MEVCTLLNYDCELTKSGVAKCKSLIPVFPARVNCKQCIFCKYLLYVQLLFMFFLKLRLIKLKYL